MMHRSLGSIATAISAFAILAFPALALADDAASRLCMPEDRLFNHEAIVSDSELAKMRGGFLDMNGILLDFSFMSRVQVGDTIRNELNVNLTDLANATRNATHIQDILQPQIIQNVNNDTIIAIQQEFNLTMIGIQQVIQQAQLQQLQYMQQAIAAQ